MSKIANQLGAVEKAQEKLAVKRQILLNKALSSTSPNDILKAQEVLKNIEERTDRSSIKSYLVDPLDFNSQFGYKDKPFMMSYQTLRNMAKAPVVNAVIKTRKNQIADFAEPQADQYSTGFIVQKKLKPGEKRSDKLSLEEERKIYEITEFLLNCGKGDTWETDDFETFIRKLVDDSLTFDQMTFEVVRDNKGEVFEFFATDASTYRIADSYIDEDYEMRNRNHQAQYFKDKVKGYYPNFVQILNGQIESEFYPWELCFGVRNPTTNINNVGYGISELEELVTTVTSLLWADEYNRRFFSQGSAPKGMLRVKGQVNEKDLSAFRQQWNGMIQGVNNAWKTPVVSADQVDWVDLQKTNKDMEFNSWMEFLIKIVCAIYSIDPNEIGFNISNSTGSSSMFESNNENKLKHSKDKGLYPLLKFVQRKINQYIVRQIDPDYEFLFMGLNGLTIEQELDLEIKKLSNFQTVNETRIKFNMDEIESGDIILNPTYTQNKMMAQQNQMQGGEQNPFLMDDEDWGDNPFLMDDESDENPFLKAFLNTLEK